MNKDERTIYRIDASILSEHIVIVDTNYPEKIDIQTIKWLNKCLEANGINYDPANLAYKVVASFNAIGECVRVDVYPLNKATLQMILKSDSTIELEI